MPSELHLHPDRLRAHAVTAAALAEELRGAVPGRQVVGEGAESERLRTAVLGAVKELAELSALLAGVAAAAQAADRHAARTLERAEDQP